MSTFLLHQRVVNTTLLLTVLTHPPFHIPVPIIHCLLLEESYFIVTLKNRISLPPDAIDVSTLLFKLANFYSFSIVNLRLFPHLGSRIIDQGDLFLLFSPVPIPRVTRDHNTLTAQTRVVQDLIFQLNRVYVRLLE